MFYSYDHDKYLQNLIDIRWNTREINRLFEDVLKTHELTEVYQNSFGKKQQLNLLQHHLRKLLCLTHDELNSTILTKKMQNDVIKIQELTAENISIKKGFLLLQRRISSTYCALNENISAQISTENQLDDHKTKLKDLKKEMSILKRQMAENERQHSQQKMNLEKQVKYLRSVQQKLTTMNSTPTYKDSTNFQNNKIQNTQSSKKRKLVMPENSFLNLPVPVSIPLSSMTAINTTVLTSNNDEIWDEHSTLNQLVTKSDICEQSPVPDEVKYIGRKVEKTFEGHGVFKGTIKSYKKPYYLIVYDDGDREEMKKEEVELHLIQNSLNT